jgi:branched-chain amino acid transport system permease protein
MFRAPFRVPTYFMAPVVLAVLSLLFPTPFVLHNLVVGSIYALLAISWDLLLGYTGILSLGHAAMFMLGAYAFVFLTAPFSGYIGGPPFGLNIHPLLGIPLSGAVAALFGLALGIITLRLRGAYLALATLGFAEILREILNREDEITRGALGLAVKPLIESGPEIFYQVQFFIVLSVLTLTLITVHFMLRSKMGYYLRSIRDDIEAAEAMGVDTVRWKLVVFVVSSFIAGVAGALYGQYVASITPVIGMVDNMGTIIAMTVIGGAGTVTGPLMGSYLVYWTMQYFREFAGLRLIVFGIFIVLVMRFFPSGMYGFLKTWALRMRRLTRGSPPSARIVASP